MTNRVKTIRKTVRVLPNFEDKMNKVKSALGFTTDTELFKYVFMYYYNNPEKVMRDYLNHPLPKE